jgi:hypothetical protein
MSAFEDSNASVDELSPPNNNLARKLMLRQKDAARRKRMIAQETQEERQRRLAQDAFRHRKAYRAAKLKR